MAGGREEEQELRAAMAWLASSPLRSPTAIPRALRGGWFPGSGAAQRTGAVAFPGSPPSGKRDRARCSNTVAGAAPACHRIPNPPRRQTGATAPHAETEFEILLGDGVAEKRRFPLWLGHAAARRFCACATRPAGASLVCDGARKDEEGTRCGPRAGTKAGAAPATVGGEPRSDVPLDLLVREGGSGHGPASQETCRRSFHPSSGRGVRRRRMQ